MLARQGFRREDLEKPEVVRSIPAMNMTGIRYVDALLKSDTEILKLECYDMEQDQMIQIGNALKKYPDIVYFSSAGDNYEITDAAATKGKILLEELYRYFRKNPLWAGEEGQSECIAQAERFLYN